MDIPYTGRTIVDHLVLFAFLSEGRLAAFSPLAFDFRKVYEGGIF
jgi:hypothetical protein